MSTAASLERGLQAQAAARRGLLDGGARAVGWKVGFNFPQIQEKLGLDGCVIGFITDRSLLEPGAETPAGCLAEFEVAIHLGADVEPDAGREEAGAAIAALGAAIEIVHPPDLGLGLEAILAGNIFHRGVTFGEPVSGVPLEGVSARAAVNGEELSSWNALEATGDPAAVVERLARVAEIAGMRLRAGERVIAGAMLPLVTPEPGDLVELDLGPLGKTSLAFT